MRLAEELSMKPMRFNKAQAQVIALLSQPESLRTHRQRRKQPAPLQTGPLVTAALADGRARSLEHLVSETGATGEMIRRFLAKRQATGDVIVTLVGGFRLYSTAYFGG